MSRPPRSWLYTPATRPDRVAKAVAGDADAVIVDLEDAVAPTEKESARGNLTELFAEEHAKPVWVRINPPGETWGDHDVAALAGLAIGGVRVPKAESPREVSALADALGRPVGLTIETALGLERAFELASAHPLVVSISLGEADLRADLRLQDARALDWARSRVVVAARAAGLASPPMSVFTDVRDLDGLRRTSEAGRADGFFGRSVVHPSQIPVVNEVFTPNPEQIESARRLVESLADHESHGEGAWLSESGQFVDAATVQAARWVLEFDTVLSTDR